MFKYKVFRQLPDHSFHEMAQTLYLVHAEFLYNNFEFGMISEVGGEIIQTKLMPTDHSSLI